MYEQNKAAHQHETGLNALYRLNIARWPVPSQTEFDRHDAAGMHMLAFRPSYKRDICAAHGTSDRFQAGSSGGTVHFSAPRATQRAIDTAEQSMDALQRCK